MNLNWLRLMYAGVWLSLGLILLLRHWLIPAEMLDGFNPNSLAVGGGLSLVFAAYNFVRWFLVARHGWRRRQAASPLARRVGKPTEYNPELDFGKADDVK